MCNCMQTCSLLKTIKVAASGSATCAWLNNEDMVSGWSDGHIRCHSTKDYSLSWTIHNAHRLESSIGVASISGGHTSKILISGGLGGELRVWAASNQGLVSHMKQHSVNLLPGLLVQTLVHAEHISSTQLDNFLLHLHPQASITAIKSFADNIHFASSSKDGTVRVWDFVKEKCLSTFSGKMGGINDMELLSDQVFNQDLALCHEPHLLNSRSYFRRYKLYRLE